MSRYIITGLPRSGTTWMANLMTYGSSFCFHEATAYCTNAFDYKYLMDSPNYDAVGNSDSGIVYIVDSVLEQNPDTKVVVIERNPDEVRESLDDIGLLNHDVVDDLHRMVKKIVNDYADLVVPFDKLFDGGAKEIWELCAPREPFNEARYELLKDMNIVTPVEVIENRAYTFWRRHHGTN